LAENPSLLGFGWNLLYFGLVLGGGLWPPFRQPPARRPAGPSYFGYLVYLLFLWDVLPQAVRANSLFKLENRNRTRLVQKPNWTEKVRVPEHTFSLLPI